MPSESEIYRMETISNRLKAAFALKETERDLDDRSILHGPSGPYHAAGGLTVELYAGGKDGDETGCLMRVFHPSVSDKTPSKGDTHLYSEMTAVNFLGRMLAG